MNINKTHPEFLAELKIRDVFCFINLYVTLISQYNDKLGFIDYVYDALLGYICSSYKTNFAKT